MMSKYFRVLIMAVLAVGLTATGAQAISDVGPERTIAKELRDGVYVIVDKREITFEVRTGIDEGDAITVTIDGGKFLDAGIAQLFQTGPPLVEIPMTRHTATEITFEIPAIGLPEGKVTLNSEDGRPFRIEIDPAATRVRVTVDVDDRGELIYGEPKTAPGNIHTIRQQFVLAGDLATREDIILVEKQLLEFVERPKDPYPPLTEGKTAVYDGFDPGLIIDTNPDIFVARSTQETVTLEITGKRGGIMDGIESVVLLRDEVAIGDFVIAYDRATLTVLLKELLEHPNPKDFTIQFTGDGNRPLEPRVFFLNATVDVAGRVLNAVTLIDRNVDPYDVDVWEYPAAGVATEGGKAFYAWEVDGLQFVAPFIRQDNLVTSVIRVENISCREAKLWLLVNNEGVWAMVGGTRYIADGGVLEISGESLIVGATLEGFTLDGTTGFAVWGIVKGVKGEPMNNKDITLFGSQQFIPTSAFRPIPMQVKQDELGWME